MNARIIIQEDSITPYLNDIENRLHASSEEIIYKIGKRFREEAQSRVNYWWGNLFESVDKPSQWQIERDPNFIKLDIVFSGITEEVEEWWGEFEDPSLPMGGRDYAYYQETGEDPIADPSHARSKWYVKRSVKPTQKFADEYLEGEIRRIMGVK